MEYSGKARPQIAARRVWTEIAGHLNSHEFRVHANSKVQRVIDKLAISAIGLHVKREVIRRSRPFWW